jgi:hypothetical protein
MPIISATARATAVMVETVRILRAGALEDGALVLAELVISKALP